MVTYNVNDERIEDFIKSLDDYDEEIESLKDYALKNDVPIIRDETRNFLRLLLRIKKPRKILELGTAIAYSTLVIYKSCDKDIDSIVTVENNIDRIKEAKTNIEKFFDDKKVVLIEDDITNYLESAEKEEKYDFVFLDAAKAQYIVWLPILKKLMKKGAVLLADNIFKDGEILESRYTIIKRDRTIHKRMREYLHEVAKDVDFDTTIFNVGDGISVSIKK
ncbi:MAG: O-methyltransferase [Lachnospiraceae bacterium]|nr:O-methyltransferase [Lachnospiraceae bacterium]